MSIRETGKKYMEERKEQELYCDICGKTIPWKQYPKITLEIEWSAYIPDGGTSNRIDICSSQCLIEKAEELHKRER